MKNAGAHADAMHDFDFLVGRWRIHHRRLTERLPNKHEWIDFGGTCVTRKILGEAGNMDEHFLDLPGDAYHALAVRTYDKVKGDWSIWWFDGRDPGHLDPPVVGRFHEGTGIFYADDAFNGRSIRVRFLWTNLHTDPRWEQAFSPDGGKTWETNWTMQFLRDSGRQ